MDLILIWSIRIIIGLILLLPFVVTSSTFFPYIVGKAIWSRILIELLFALWVVLAVRRPEYRLPRSWIAIAFGLFVIGDLISAAAGVSFTRSFWGHFERMQGTFDLLHWFAFTLVIISVVRTVGQWRTLLFAQVTIGLLISLLGIVQKYQLVASKYMPEPVNDRLFMTLGNPTFAAGYMMLTVVIAAGLLAHSMWGRGRTIEDRAAAPDDQDQSQERRRTARREQTRRAARRSRRRAQQPPNPPLLSGPWIYRSILVATIALCLWMMFETQTRSVLAGLIAALALAGAAYAVWGARTRVRIAAGALSVALLLISSIVFSGAASGLFRNTEESSPESSSFLGRLSDIGSGDVSISARLVAYRISLQAFADRPLAGYGSGQFNVPWNKFTRVGDYDSRPEILDLAHSKPFDVLATAGLAGFLPFTAMWALAAWYAFRRMRDPEQPLFLAITLAAGLLAWFAYVAVLFETSATVIFFMLFLAWAASGEAAVQRRNRYFLPGDSMGLDPHGETAPSALRETPGSRTWRNRNAVIVLVVAMATFLALFITINLPMFNQAKVISFAAGETGEQAIPAHFPPVASYPRTQFFQNVPRILSEISNPGAESANSPQSIVRQLQLEAEAAIAAEPFNVLLHVAISEAYRAAAFAITEKTEEYSQIARQHSDRALELGPNQYVPLLNVLRQAIFEADLPRANQEWQVFTEKYPKYLEYKLVEVDDVKARLDGLRIPPSPDWDVYLSSDRLVYVNEQCDAEDVEHIFFLHVNPVDLDDLSVDQRQYGFEGLDFSFVDFGVMAEGKCRADRKLPDYPISYIATGQYRPGEDAIWREESPFLEFDIPPLPKAPEKRVIPPSPDWDVYRSGDSLVYVNEQCAAEDVEHIFFLHVAPVDPDDLPVDQRQYGFEGLDFSFADFGVMLEGECRAGRKLPNYPISSIATGQYVPGEGAVWREDFPFGELENLDIPSPDWDVSRSEDRLVYVNEQCDPEDVQPRFYLHVFPVDLNDLPADRRQHGFDNLDFSIANTGVTVGGKCQVDRMLPDYPVSRVATGQVIPGGASIWREESPFGQVDSPPSIPNWGVYLSDDILVYVNEQCTAEDVVPLFDLHVYPVDLNDLPVDRRQQGFDNLGFRFANTDVMVGGKCQAARRLPDYPIARITTGQSISAAGRGWLEESPFVQFGAAPPSPEWDVYLSDGRLVYLNEQCDPEDVEHRFSVRIYPVDLNDLPVNLRQLGFDNRLVFDLSDVGVAAGGKCRVDRTLPDYPIARITTGQFISGGDAITIWAEESPFPEIDIPPSSLEWDVYLDDRRLLYVNDQCDPQDLQRRFYLHVYPVDLNDLPVDRRQHGFDNNLDFSIADTGVTVGRKCQVDRMLPDYPIARIETGQFTSGDGPIWQEESPFLKVRTRNIPPSRRGWDVYLRDDTMVYLNEQCAPEDVEPFFYLHLVPLDSGDLPARRQEHGFNNLDFSFADFGVMGGGKCRAERKLPDYTPSRITTGQYLPGEDPIWLEESPFIEVDAPHPSPDWDVYRSDGRLVYVNEQCTAEDVEPRFYLHVYPVDPGDLPLYRRQHGFDNNLDFSLTDIGVTVGGKCRVERELPDYPVSHVETGQFISEEGPIWLEESPFRELEIPPIPEVRENLGIPTSRDWDIYLDRGRLIYVNEQCAPEDLEPRFYLHLYPVDPDDLPAHRRQHGFDNLDFSFADFGATVQGECRVERKLPEYPVSRIATGQYTSGGGPIWGEESPFRELNAPPIPEIPENLLIPSSPDWDVHLSGDGLAYVNEQCTAEDLEPRFYLHLYPVDPDDLPADRRQHGFDSLDFSFADSGVMGGGRCRVERKLPDYPVSRIATGQFISWQGYIWKLQILLPQ